MEWINPERAHIVAALRQRQAAAPSVTCVRCKGTGETVPAAPCVRCDGAGEIAGGARMFITH